METALQQVKKKIANEYKFGEFTELLLHLYKFGRHEHQETLGANDGGMIPLLRGEIDAVIEKVACDFATVQTESLKSDNDRLREALEHFTILNPEHYKDIAGFILKAKETLTPKP